MKVTNPLAVRMELYLESPANPRPRPTSGQNCQAEASSDGCGKNCRLAAHAATANPKSNAELVIARWYGFRPYGIKELARTGIIAMPRGNSTLSAPDDESGNQIRRESIAKPARSAAGMVREPTQEELEATPPG